MSNSSYLPERVPIARHGAQPKAPVELIRGLIERGGEVEAAMLAQMEMPWRQIIMMVCGRGHASSKAERLDAFERAIHPLDNGKEIYKAVFPEPPTISALPGLMSADELRTTQYEPLAWAIPRLLPSGLALLAGQAKAGKSWLALQMAKAVASGTPIFDKTPRRGRVLYLALEDRRERIKRRTAKQGWPDGLEVFFYTEDDFRKHLRSLDGTGGIMLGREMQRGRYRLVVIDTLSQAFEGGTSLTAMVRQLAPLHRQANELNCAVLLIDHHRKQRGFDENAIDDIHGSIAKSGVSDTILGLYHQGGRARLRVKGRDVVDRRIKLRFDGQRGLWEYEGEGEEVELNWQQEAILAYVQEAGPSQTQEIAAGVGLDYGNLHRKLQRLVDVGMLERVEGEDGVKYAVRAQHAEPLQD